MYLKPIVVIYVGLKNVDKTPTSISYLLKNYAEHLGEALSQEGYLPIVVGNIDRADNHLEMLSPNIQMFSDEENSKEYLNKLDKLSKLIEENLNNTKN